MASELIAAPLLAAIAIAVFHSFAQGVPAWQRAAKWAVYLGVSSLLTLRVGRPWSLVWIWGAPGAAVALHVFGCARLGIHPLTAKPRARLRVERGGKGPDARA